MRPLEFFHPLIGAAILEDIAPGARRIAHRRAAVLVEGDVQGSLARVAAHLLACGPAGDEWVVQRLRDAAGEALDRGAPDIAAAYLRRALAEPPTDAERATLLLLLGTAEWRAGERDAILHLEQSLAAADDDLRTFTDASFLLSIAYNVMDQAERAVGVLERMLAALGDTDARLTLTVEAAIVTFGMMNERTAADAFRRAEQLRARLPTMSDPPVLVLVVLAHYAARGNQSAEARELVERALACEPYPPPLEICNLLIIALTFVERYDVVQQLCEDMLQATRRRGALQETIGILVSRAWASCDCGALADAEADARWALERAEGVRRIHAVGEVIRSLVERDELKAAGEVLQRYADLEVSRSVDMTQFLIARGRLRAAECVLQEALDDFLECGRRCEALGVLVHASALWRGEAALVHAALGNDAEARRLAGEELELARVWGCPRMLGISLRVYGLISGGEHGIELLREAVRTLERSQSPLELARALADRGAMLRRAGHRLQARADLERSLDLAHHLGARRIAVRAREELIAVGAKPRRDAITGRDALTAGELRVARLAAEGLTNREIAQALFITTKTAKAHLSAVYRKLGITRRGQLPNALTGELGDSRADPSAAIP